MSAGKRLQPHHCSRHSVVGRVSLAAIGYHFSSKDALLTEALLLAFGEWIRSFNRRCGAQSCPTSRRPSALKPPGQSSSPRSKLTVRYGSPIRDLHANGEPAGDARVSSGNLHAARTGLAAMFLNQEESSIRPYCAHHRHIPPCASLRADPPVAHRSRERALSESSYRSPAQHG